MDDAPTAPEPAPDRTVWSILGWIVVCLVLVALVVGIWLKVGADRAGANLGRAVIAGERPVAPTLPSTRIEGADVPGLPSWYRAPGSNAGPNAGSNAGPSPDAEVLVVNWWASWCGPCIEEAPALAKIAKDYDGRVVVVGLNAGAQDLESDARGFARDQKVAYPLVRGTRADEDAWGVGGFPETFVVGTDGRISSFVNGPIDEETLRELVDAELDEDRT